MKYLNHRIACSALLLLSSHLARAQDSGAEKVVTPFWEAPQLRSLLPTISYLGNPSDLLLECKLLKNNIEWMDREKFETARSKSQLQSERFEAIFSLGNLEIAAVSEGKENEKDKLPLYSQNRSVTAYYLEEGTSYKVIAKAGSLTDTARKKFKLEESKVLFSYDSDKGEYFLKILGRDVACDFLDKKLEIQALPLAEVTLPESQYDELSSFYLHKIQATLNDVLSTQTPENERLAAARLGVRFGRQISELPGQDEESTVRQIGGLFELLFKKNSLKNSDAVLETNNGKQVLVLKGSGEEPVELTLKLE